MLNQKTIAEAYYPLLELMKNEFGLTLLVSEMNEIIEAVEQANINIIDLLKTAKDAKNGVNSLLDTSKIKYATKKMLEAEKFVEYYIKHADKSPTYREVQEALSLKSVNSAYHRLRRWRHRMKIRPVRQLKEIKPVGDYIINSGVEYVQTENGAYYHYRDVCTIISNILLSKEQFYTNYKKIHDHGFINGRSNLISIEASFKELIILEKG